MPEPKWSDPQLQRVLEHYRKGELSGHEAKVLVEGWLRGHGAREAKTAGQPPEGYYYKPEEVKAYNQQVYAYNKQVREYRSSVVKTLLSGSLPRLRPPDRGDRDALLTTYIVTYTDRGGGEQTKEFASEREATEWAGGYEATFMGPDASLAPEPQVRRVSAGQHPISSFYSELSPAGSELGYPADTRPVYGPGREPTSLEQVMQIVSTPSQILRAAGEGVMGAAGELPSDPRLQTSRQALYFAGGVASGAGTVLDPATYLALPGTITGGIAYLRASDWNIIQADVSRTLGKYTGSRMARPELLAGDIGFQVGSILAFKGVTSLAGRGYRVATSLPAEPLGSKGLAVISGESPLGFRQAWQVAGVESPWSGLRGLRSFMKMPGVSVASVESRLTMDVVGGSTGLAPLPFRQAFEVARQYGGVKVPTPSLLRFLGLPGVTTALPRAARHVPGSSFLKFMSMPGAVEPFVPRGAPVSNLRDISSILGVKEGKATANLVARARTAAEERATDLERFMRSTFEVPKPTGRAALVTVQTDVRQLTSMGRRAAARDVFPYEVLSFPSDTRLRGPTTHVEMPKLILSTRQDLGVRQDLSMRQDLSVKQDLSMRQDLSVKQIISTRQDLRLQQHTRVDQDLSSILKFRQPQVHRQRTGLTLKSIMGQETAQTQTQREISLQGFMSVQPPRARSKVRPPTAHTKKRRRKQKPRRDEELFELRTDPLNLRRVKVV